MLVVASLLVAAGAFFVVVAGFLVADWVGFAVTGAYLCGLGVVVGRAAKPGES